MKPAANGVDVDIVFRVEERRTGNINFGASLGQGTGVGGFLGLEEPNLFGRGKRGKLQWQFGKNINDFTLSYTDPGHPGEPDLRARSRCSTPAPATPSATSAAGSRPAAACSSASRSWARATPGSSPPTRISASATPRARRTCAPGSAAAPAAARRSAASILRDTRVGLPFADRRLAHQRERRAERRLPGRHRRLPEGGPRGPLVRAAGHAGRRRPARRRGTVRARPHGQVGVHLRRRGAVLHRAVLARRGAVRRFRCAATTSSRSRRTASTRAPAATQASPDAFGKSYAAFTVEAGARISQSLYLSTFFDAGNVYRSARQWDPTRLFRGAGFGAAVISPLGPIGIDLGYGFDKVDGAGRPDPGLAAAFQAGQLLLAGGRTFHRELSMKLFVVGAWARDFDAAGCGAGGRPAAGRASRSRTSTPRRSSSGRRDTPRPSRPSPRSSRPTAARCRSCRPASIPPPRTSSSSR